MTVPVTFYGISLIVGGLVTSTLLYLLGVLWRPPLLLVAILALLLGGLRFIWPDSVALGGYKVPRQWSAAGLTTFLSVFGLLLGMGVVTTMPSPAMIVLLLWAWHVHSFALIAATFTAFSAARLLTTLLALQSRRRSGLDVDVATDKLNDRLSSVPRIEALASVALGISLLIVFA